MEAKVARWREVESGARYTAATAMARYPQLTWYSFDALPCEFAWKPKAGNSISVYGNTFAKDFSCDLKHCVVD